jgi:site-specific recombinase XerD
MFKEFIESNGNSQNVRRIYCGRVADFLSRHPEATELGKEELRSLVESYVEELPVTTAVGMAATAVRYYWSMRFGERWCARFDFADYAEDEKIEEECRRFERWLAALGRLSATTIKDRVRKVKAFLYTQFHGAFSRERVNLEAVHAFLSDGLGGKSAATRQGFCTEVRSYARFLESQGFGRTAGPVVRMAYRGPVVPSRLPACIPPDDYERIRESVDVSHARGKRDLAMLLLMGNLGLRRSDVALLGIDDVDWSEGVLHVRNSKSVSDRSIPLDAETGQALEDYVVNGRPRVRGGALFLPCGNERRGDRMTFDQVGEAMRLAAQRAGVRFGGTHSLRRRVASSMVNNGVPVKFVADILGHESPKTTMLYLRVDEGRLRAAASPWPGEVRR